jgi:Protein of unknown function (DUF3866)
VPTFRTGTVTTILSEREGLQRVEVDGRKAYVLTALIGDVTVGDRVVVNTTAVELGLGTGGWDVVHWNLARDGWNGNGDGHVMKLRYTSLQCDTGVAEERPGYDAGGLEGMPVVVCGVHSQVAAVGAVFKDALPGRKLVYVMTDVAALPLAVSDLVADLRAAGLVDGTITAGQAFGGDHEAVNVPSALRVARFVAGADAVVVGPGPGGVGTATQLGFGALEVGGVVDAARRDGGVPIVALRWSGTDERERHRGVSHHSRTALAWVGSGATVAVPRGEPLVDVGEHERVEVDVADVGALLAAAGIAVTTMGRTPEEEPGFFRYAGAAGAAAAAAVAKGVMQ